MKSGIYKITSPSGYIYIGKSNNIKKRWSSYKRADCYRQPRLLRSLKKHGAENHTFEVVEYCDVNLMSIRERHWQDFYDVCGNKGLNCILVSSDEKPAVYSEELKIKLSKIRKGKLSGDKHPLFGKKHTPEARLKIKEARSKQIISHSKETRLKMGLAGKGRKMSPESIEKNRLAKLGKPSWNKGKKNIMGAYANMFKLNGCKGIELISDYFSGLSLISLSKKHNMKWEQCQKYLKRKNVKIRSISEQSKLNYARKINQN